MRRICPNCGAAGMAVFYEQEAAPVACTALVHTQEEALNCPRGNVSLGFCRGCGFISNGAFDAGLQAGVSVCETTQGFSSTFNAFNRDMAHRLMRRHALHDKDIIEIGCGNGEFLVLLCEEGENRGVGFDPAYVEGRVPAPDRGCVAFVKDFYSEKYARYRGDFVCCKMTLEHLPRTAEFVRCVRRSVGDRPETTVFFQVPDATRILRKLAFWDIYYDHCSYFSPVSLAAVFERCGFQVLDLRSEYAGQYLTIEARPGNGSREASLVQEEELVSLRQDVAAFSRSVRPKIGAWRHELREMSEAKRRVVLWGSGSKAVGFLTAVGVREEVPYVVDVNPYRQETYVPGTGQKTVGPEFLKSYRPDVVIVMNPVYCEEIVQDLGRAGLYPEVRTP